MAYWRKVYELTEECWQLLPDVDRLAWANGPKPRYLTGRDFFGRVNAIQIGRWQQFLRTPPPILFEAPPQLRMAGGEALPARLACQLPQLWTEHSQYMLHGPDIYRQASVGRPTMPAAWAAAWEQVWLSPPLPPFWDELGSAFQVGFYAGLWYVSVVVHEFDLWFPAVPSVVQRPGAWRARWLRYGQLACLPPVDVFGVRFRYETPSAQGLWPTSWPARVAGRVPARFQRVIPPAPALVAGYADGSAYQQYAIRTVEVPT